MTQKDIIMTYLYADLNRAGTTLVHTWCCQLQKRTFSQFVYLGDNVAQQYYKFNQSGVNLDSPFRYLDNEPYVPPENVNDFSATFDIDFYTRNVEITYFNDEDIILSKEITSAILHKEPLTQDDLLETRVILPK